MKNLLLSIFVMAGLAACNNNPSQDTSNREIQLLSDSTLYNSNVFSDTPVTVKAEAVPAIVSERPHSTVRAKKRIQAKNAVPAPVYTKSEGISPVAVPPVTTPPVVAPADKTTVGTNSTGNDPNSGTVATIPQEKKKKGWSKAAQGAAIGGVTGAVGGAILSKKKGLGAVVGGIVGAAGGYIIGKGMDKKDNQFEIE